MTKRIFIDTNPFIYLIGEQHPYYEKVLTFITEAVREEAEFYTSTITDAEYLVQPYDKDDYEQVDAYHTYLDEMQFLKCFITDKIGERAAMLRAKYKYLKLGDALQLAASIDCACDSFLTNDKQLKQVAEAHVIYLGDL